MTMNRFAHANAHTVEEAVETLGEACRPLAGGTDLLSLMKEGLVSPDRLVNLKTIAGLDHVDEREDGWHIGAMTSLAELAAHPSINGRRDVACLYESINQAASPQIRHMATVGGSLMQRPRCWYFRNRLTRCWLKGGRRCLAVQGENKYHAVLGRSPCNAVHPSDPAVALSALDASVVVAGPAGLRSIPLSGFYQSPSRDARKETVIALDEVITEIFVPAPDQASRGTYVKAAERGSWDFALASTAIQLAFSGRTVRDARVVLGGVAQIPWRAVDAEDALKGRELSPEVIKQAAQVATAAARSMTQNEYKVDLTQGVVRQALRDLLSSRSS